MQTARNCGEACSSAGTDSEAAGAYHQGNVVIVAAVGTGCDLQLSGLHPPASSHQVLAGGPDPAGTAYACNTVQTQVSRQCTHLSVVFAAGGGRKDEPGWERVAHVQLLVATAGGQVVAVGSRAAGACKGGDAVRALVDQVDQSG